jgi:hypothetical protein
MPLKEFYQTRINTFQQKADILQRLENRLSTARLITFVCIFVFFFSLHSFSITLAVAGSVTCIITFGILIRRYVETEKLKEYHRHLVEINTLELKSLAGDSSKFADGSEFIDRDHANSYDLDLFGRASVFQFMNRTGSLPGASMLARWLMEPAHTGEIRSRQQAVAALKPEIDWRQKMMTVGHFTRHSLDNPGELLTWMTCKNEFPGVRRLKILTLVLSTMLAIAITVTVIAGLPVALLLPFLLANFLFYFSQGTRINRLHQQVSKSADLIKNYAEIINMIEEKEFDTDKLQTLRLQVKGPPSASEAINQLSDQVGRLDTRLNIMVSIPLNLFFFWDIHCCLALEKWKQQHAGDIDRWLAVMAEFEVLNSIANMAYNNPLWVMPEIVSGYFTIQAKDVGHPLIPDHRRILNDIDITGSSRIVIVTGSNMAGKSTFLRTCGVNAVLALAGAPVCASSFTLSHVQVISSMRISDSLEDNTSSFYAELKKLAAIIQQAGQNRELFILLDEILRGTNSNDRFTGSVALIRQLIGYDTVAMVATHDLKLADLENEIPGNIDNYHFDVKIDKEELYFDYKLNPGVCKSMNASILMKKMGIKI